MTEMSGATRGSVRPERTKCASMQPCEKDQKSEMDATPDPTPRKKHVEDEYPEDQRREDRNAQWSSALHEEKQAADQSGSRDQRINDPALGHGIDQSLRGFVLFRDRPWLVEKVVQEPGAANVGVEETVHPTQDRGCHSHVELQSLVVAA